MSAKASKRQVGISTKIAYGLGSGLPAVKNMLFHFFFLFYFSNILGISEWLVLAATMIVLTL